MDSIEAETGLSRKQTRDWVPERLCLTLEEAESTALATGPWVGGVSPRVMQELVRKRLSRCRWVPFRAPGAGGASPGSGGPERRGKTQSSDITVMNDNVIAGVWVLGVFSVLAAECETAAQQRIARANSSTELVRGTNT